jgi:hypothetical protein
MALRHYSPSFPSRIFSYMRKLRNLTQGIPTPSQEECEQARTYRDDRLAFLRSNNPI